MCGSAVMWLMGEDFPPLFICALIADASACVPTL